MTLRLFTAKCLAGAVGLCIATLSLVYAVGIQAAEPVDTGNQLVTQCNDGNYQARNERWSYCVAYVVGVADGVQLGILNTLHDYNGLAAKNAGSKMSLISHYCMPDENVTYNQMALVVSKYLHEHPESLNLSSVVLVVYSFDNAWPCGSK